MCVDIRLWQRRAGQLGRLGRQCLEIGEVRENFPKSDLLVFSGAGESAAIAAH